jgi:hypothetical protein
VNTAAPAPIAGTAIDSFRDVPLVAHPRAGGGAVQSLSVSGTLQRTGSFTVELLLAAELRAVQWVATACSRRRRDELWRHTCFELFVRPGEAANYCEFNFAPCGDWAAYEFDHYRAPARAAAQPPVEISAQTIALAQIRLRARVELLAAFGRGDRAQPGEQGSKLNCAAVIEASDGTLTYWAIHHPRAQPDFHHADGFRVALRDSPWAAASEAAP